MLACVTYALRCRRAVEGEIGAALILSAKRVHGIFDGEVDASAKEEWWLADSLLLYFLFY